MRLFITCFFLLELALEEAIVGWNHHHHHHHHDSQNPKKSQSKTSQDSKSSGVVFVKPGNVQILVPIGSSKQGNKWPLQEIPANLPKPWEKKTTEPAKVSQIASQVAPASSKTSEAQKSTSDSKMSSEKKSSKGKSKKAGKSKRRKKAKKKCPTVERLLASDPKCKNNTIQNCQSDKNCDKVKIGFMCCADECPGTKTCQKSK